MNTINNPEVKSSSNPAGGSVSGAGSTFGACGTVALSYMMLQELRELYEKIAAILNTGYATNIENQAKAGVANAQAANASITADGINQIIQGAENLVAAGVSGFLAVKSYQATNAHATERTTLHNEETEINAKIKALKGLGNSEDGVELDDMSQTPEEKKALEADLDKQLSKNMKAQKRVDEKISSETASLQNYTNLVNQLSKAVCSGTGAGFTMLQKAKNEEIRSVTQTTSQIEGQISNAYLQGLQGEWQDMEALNQTLVALNQSQNTRG